MVRNQRALILHVITSLGRGGAERQLVNLVSNMDRTRFQHTVAFLREPDDLAAEIRAAECECICLGARGKRRWVYAAKMLRQIIKAEKPDIIHSSLYDANLSIRLAAPFGSTIPLVVSVQSADYAPETLAAANLPRGKVGLIRVLDSFSARWTDPLFVACSDFVKKSVSERLKIPLARVEVIYNSVDPKTLESSASDVDSLKMALGIPAEGFVFLNVGRLDPAKGQTVLLKSFQQIANRMPNAYLVVLGQGPLKQQLIELANGLGISEKVLLPGARPDVGNFLSLADVFVFPSWFEGLPLALIEGMSKGLPCIVSDIETLREVAKDEETGLLVTPGSVDELANAMLELYENPVKRTFLGERAQQEANRRFDIAETIRQWEKLYSRLAWDRTSPVNESIEEQV